MQPLSEHDNASDAGTYAPVVTNTFLYTPYGNQLRMPWRLIQPAEQYFCHCSGANTMEKGHAHKEASQSSSLSGGPSQQEVGFKQTIQRTVERRNTWNGPSPGVADVLETAPSTFNHKQKHVAILKSK